MVDSSITKNLHTYGRPVGILCGIIVTIILIASALIFLASKKQEIRKREEMIDALADGVSAENIESLVGRPFLKRQHENVSFWFYEDSEGGPITLVIRDGKLDKHAFLPPQQ